MSANKLLTDYDQKEDDFLKVPEVNMQPLFDDNDNVSGSKEQKLTQHLKVLEEAGEYHGEEDYDNQEQQETIQIRDPQVINQQQKSEYDEDEEDEDTDPPVVGDHIEAIPTDPAHPTPVEDPMEEGKAIDEDRMREIKCQKEAQVPNTDLVNLQENLQWKKKQEEERKRQIINKEKERMREGLKKFAVEKKNTIFESIIEQQQKDYLNSISQKNVKPSQEEQLMVEELIKKCNPHDQYGTEQKKTAVEEQYEHYQKKECPITIFGCGCCANLVLIILLFLQVGSLNLKFTEQFDKQKSAIESKSDLLQLLNDWKRPTISQIKVVSKNQSCGKDWIPIFTNHFSGLKTVWNNNDPPYYSFAQKNISSKHLQIYSKASSQTNKVMTGAKNLVNVGNNSNSTSNKSNEVKNGTTQTWNSSISSNSTVNKQKQKNVTTKMLYLGAPALEQSIMNGKIICGKKSVTYFNSLHPSECQKGYILCDSTNSKHKICVKSNSKQDCPITKIDIQIGNCKGKTNCAQFNKFQITYQRGGNDAPLNYFVSEVKQPCKNITQTVQPFFQANLQTTPCDKSDDRYLKVNKQNLSLSLGQIQKENNVSSIIQNLTLVKKQFNNSNFEINQTIEKSKFNLYVDFYTRGSFQNQKCNETKIVSSYIKANELYGRLKIARQLDISVLSLFLSLFGLFHLLLEAAKDNIGWLVICVMLLLIILKSISTNFVLTASEVIKNYLQEGMREGVSCGLFKGPAFSHEQMTKQLDLIGRMDTAIIVLLFSPFMTIILFGIVWALLEKLKHSSTLRQERPGQEDDDKIACCKCCYGEKNSKVAKCCLGFIFIIVIGSLLLAFGLSKFEGVPKTAQLGKIIRDKNFTTTLCDSNFQSISHLFDHEQECKKNNLIIKRPYYSRERGCYIEACPIPLKKGLTKSQNSSIPDKLVQLDVKAYDISNKSIQSDNMDKYVDNTTGCVSYRIVGYAWMQVKVKPDGYPVKIEAEPDYWYIDLPRKIGFPLLFGGVPLLNIIFFKIFYESLLKNQIKEQLKMSKTAEEITKSIWWWIDSNKVQNVLTEDGQLLAIAIKNGIFKYIRDSGEIQQYQFFGSIIVAKISNDLSIGQNRIKNMIKKDKSILRYIFYVCIGHVKYWKLRYSMPPQAVKLQEEVAQALDIKFKIFKEHYWKDEDMQQIIESFCRIDKQWESFKEILRLVEKDADLDELYMKPHLKGLIEQEPQWRTIPNKTDFRDKFITQNKGITQEVFDKLKLEEIHLKVCFEYRKSVNDMSEKDFIKNFGLEENEEIIEKLTQEYKQKKEKDEYKTILQKIVAAVGFGSHWLDNGQDIYFLFTSVAPVQLNVIMGFFIFYQILFMVQQRINDDETKLMGVVHVIIATIKDFTGLTTLFSQLAEDSFGMEVARWLRVQLMATENVGQLMVQTYIIIKMGGQMNIFQMVSPFITFFFVAMEVFLYANHITVFICKSIMLLVCCVGELIIIYTLMEQEDNRSENVKKKFPLVRWDKTQTWLKNFYPYIIAVFGIILIGGLYYLIKFTSCFSKTEDINKDVDEQEIFKETIDKQNKMLEYIFDQEIQRDQRIVKQNQVLEELRQQNQQLISIVKDFAQKNQLENRVMQENQSRKHQSQVDVEDVDFDLNQENDQQ